MLQPLLRPVAVAANDRLHGAPPLWLPAPPALDLDFVGRPSLQYPGLPPIAFARASAATRVNASGLLESVASGTPRFDHHPMTGARRGLLIEDARTNLIPRSEDFAHAAWTKDNAAVGAAASGPDGNAGAQALIEDTGTGQHRARQIGASFTAGAVLAVSCFLKAVGRGFATLQFGAANGFRACFDLDAGTLAAGFTGEAFGTGAFVSAGIQPMPGGWRRCWVVGQEDPAATQGEAYLNIVRGSAYTDSYTGDGAGGIRAWGYQAEAGAFPTSYIATADTTATRAADVAVMASLSPWFNESEGTLLVEASVLAAASGAAFILASFNDGTTVNEVDVRLRATNIPAGVVTVSSVSQANVQAAPMGPAANFPFQLAMTYKIDDVAASAFGNTASSDTSATLPIVSRLELGAFGGANRMSGHIRRVVYWPCRSPNSVLQAISR